MIAILSLECFIVSAKTPSATVPQIQERIDQNSETRNQSSELAEADGETAKVAKNAKGRTKTGEPQMTRTPICLNPRTREPLDPHGEPPMHLVRVGKLHPFPARSG